MKKISYILAAFVSAIVLASCDTREPAISNIVPCVIGEVPTETMDIRAIMKERENLFTLTWSQAQFKTESGEVKVAPIIYNIEFDNYGNGFAAAKAYQIIPGNASSFAIPVTDFGSWVLTNIDGAKGGVECKLEVRIKAQYGDGETFVYSANAKSFTIIPYGLQPMYVIGDWNQTGKGEANWDTTDKTYRMFRKSNSASDFTYFYTGPMMGEFKLIGKDALGTQEMYYDAGDGKLAVGVHQGDAFKVPVDGEYYTINIDLNTMTFTFESYDVTKSQTKGKDFTTPGVGFIGDFNSWGGDIPLTQSPYNPHLWSCETGEITGGYAKWRTVGSWNDKWCPQENNLPFGLADYNPTTHDNCIVPETGNYYLQLDDMTGYYIAEKIN